VFLKLKQRGLLAAYENEEDRRMARIQLSIIAFNCFFSTIVFFINLATWEDGPLTTILILGYVLNLILFVLVTQKHLLVSSFILTSTYVIMVSAIATIGGGLHDYVVIFYPVIIMYSGLMAQKRGLIFATLLTIAGLSWLVFGEIFGWFVITASHIADRTDLLVALILVLLAALMVHILISNMEYGLTQTWRELAERKRVEKELRKLTLVVEQSPASIMIADLDGKIEYVNPRFTQITGYDFKEIVGGQIGSLKTNSIPRQVYQDLKTSKTGKEWRGEFENRRRDGFQYYESAIVSIITDLNGGASHYLTVEEDITERVRDKRLLEDANQQLRADMAKIGQLQAELREQAIHDPLTGLFNRRYLTETLVRELSRAERENSSLSMIMSDIDNFKNINDTYGHLVGDKFLVEIANLMNNNLRGSDIICRYGGEEFLAVLPCTTLETAAQRAEEIRTKCAEIIIQHEGVELKLTISSGVATYPDHGREAKEIIIKADKALYQAKHNGRNQVMIWSEDQ